jgi:hypothetical protein
MSITIPKNMQRIDPHAFDGCNKLVEVINKSSLSITADPSSNDSIAYYAMEVHTEPTKIVNQNNYLFYSYNGINYLIGYIGTDTQLTLPENYNGQNYEIYKYAFADCKNLISITIPKRVTSIGDVAFYRCTALTSIYYGGSESEWKQLTDQKHKATVYFYSENTPTVEGNYWHFVGSVPTVWNVAG